MKAIKHGKLFRVYALLDKNKNGTKNFFIGHMCGSKVAESVYQTLPRTQHNSIPNILDNNLRRNDWNYKKIISSNESLSGEKKRKKITKRLISFYTCMKNLTSLLVSIEKFFHESERYDKNKSYILPKN